MRAHIAPKYGRMFFILLAIHQNAWYTPGFSRRLDRFSPGSAVNPARFCSPIAVRTFPDDGEQPRDKGILK
jgi:hypothetical protein